MAKSLEKIYYDIKNPASYGGVYKLYQAAKKSNPLITLQDVEEWLKSQDTYTLFRKIKRNYATLSVIVDRIDEQWQADLMDMTWFQSYNDGYKYLLTVIDILSRYAWVVPLKNKSSQTLLESFQELFKRRKPEKLQTDQGTEFKNSLFKNYLNKQNVIFFTTTDDTIKCALVERFNRTLRSKIYRYVYTKSNYRYIDVLDNIMESYNNSYHRTIDMSPAEVNESNRLTVLRNIKKSRSVKPSKARALKVGQYVRIARKKALFEKGSTANFSYETFKIRSIKKTDIGYIYKIEDMDGEEITSIFYRDNLLPVDEPSLYKVEKILKTRVNSKTKKKESFVKWIGYPKKFNSWIEDEAILY